MPPIFNVQRLITFAAALAIMMLAFGYIQGIISLAYLHNRSFLRL